MKLRPTLLATSLLANALLAGVFVARPALRPDALRNHRLSPPCTAHTGNRDGTASPASLALPTERPQPAAEPASLWAALDSDDLRTLVERLRAAGFSRTAIRAIAGARLEDRFAARTRELAARYENTPFWKPDPLTGIAAGGFFEEFGQLFRERSRALRELLGPDALRAAEADRLPQRFGALAPAKVEFAQRINDDYADMAAQVRAGTGGIVLPEDREKLALLERERRADLAALFTPEELDEFERRTSPLTQQLRTTLTMMDATEGEFRAIFKVRQAFAEPREPADPIAIARGRAEAQQAMAQQLKAALGEARYADYVRAATPEYQQLYRIARQENVPLDAAARAFALRDTAARESAQIVSNPALDADAKRSALQALGRNTRAQVLGTLGPAAGPAYVQTARWIGHLEGGGAVALTPDGNLSYRSLPRR